MIKYPRSTIAALTLSAAGFAGIVLHEGYSNNAIIPVPGDVPTVGFGSTVHEDGTPVRMGETIAPPRAVRLSVAHISKDEKGVRQCLGETATLYQHEWDAFVRLSHNVGAYNVCKSSIVPKVQREDYKAACDTILDFKKAIGKDCSVRSNGCYGVWLDRLATHKLCLGEP